MYNTPKDRIKNQCLRMNTQRKNKPVVSCKCGNLFHITKVLFLQFFNCLVGWKEINVARSHGGNCYIDCFLLRMHKKREKERVREKKQLINAKICVKHLCYCLGYCQYVRSEKQFLVLSSHNRCKRIDGTVYLKYVV